MTEKEPNKKRKRAPLPPAPTPAAPMMDRRAMEKMMADITRLLNEQEFATIDEANAFLQTTINAGTLPTFAPETPLERAQEVIYQAYEARTKPQRVKLARQALEISSDCADAYVLLAEETTKTPQEAKPLYEQGVAAGERTLGLEAFKEDVGHFWGILETRPYMRARAGLAQTLWVLGEQQAASAHFTDMLRLNPGDNQGIRYLLASCLLEVGDDAALGKLLDRYKEDASASWRYTRALWLFRREGTSRRATIAINKALRDNPFVPLYLLGVKKIPRRLPELIGMGDESEAIDYAVEAVPAWHSTPGAVEWLAERFARESGLA